ncbi:MAG: pilus assembly protein PilM [candidate division KSB1 bacterium]|nr:pilus assembly protein PilM [candidate division KSB1 bacterium]MDZ7300438.1 pilus assembly protein PilM [candidate division KSB1 bacterium]MDZ7308717.1 pilus assembly protein PilM [candidate division KSB1 bacterium]MDZ7351460.1 pilus assembly protein PilM [candidate division KSB1 bacterium]MDZ7355819.1 pilus assembly protein PilM [candidate division KSB1 bacterium]
MKTFSFTARLPDELKEQLHELWPQPRRFVAIEFERGVLKFLMIAGRPDREQVRYLKVKFLSSDKHEEILKTLRTHMQAMGLPRGARVTITVPQQDVHVKLWRLPSQDPAELRQMIRFRLQKEIPLPMADIVFDYRPVAQEADGHTRILVVVARRQKVEHYSRLCRQVGLVVEAVRLSGEATYHEFRKTLQALPELASQCLVLVDVDFAATTVNIIDRGNLVFCRSLARSVSDLMDRLTGPSAKHAYVEWIDELASGVADTIAAFQRHGWHAASQHVVLTGWLPQVRAIGERLTDHLGLTVSWFDPTIPLTATAQTETELTTHRWFSIAALLGMVEKNGQSLMDLRPEAERQSLRRRELRRQLTYLALLTVYLLVLIWGTLTLTLHRREARLAQLRQEIATLQPRVKAIKRWQQAREAMAKQLGTDLTAAVVAQVLEVLPAGIELNSLTFARGDGLLVRGTAGSLAEVFDLPQFLAPQPALGECVIHSANRRKQTDGTEIVEFEMKIDLQTPDKSATHNPDDLPPP